MTSDPLVAYTCGWFPNSVEFGLKGLSPNHQQDKSPSRLGLDRVQWLGSPSSLHHIIYSTLFELE